jgi:epsilon-lactone hydrolase
MQDAVAALRDRQEAGAGQAPAPLEERRAAFIPGDRLHRVPDDVLVTEVTAGGVPAHWLDAPGAGPGRVLLFLHGGGYELGSLRSDGELAARLGRASGMRVLFPEYRLAPEHPFPAAIDDVLAAWRWLRTSQELSAASLAVAGDSAGGGLATALLVALRDAGQALPAAAALMSPTVDLTSSGASMSERADQDPVSTPAMLRQFAAGYLAGADPETPLASPLFASLAGLPPLLIQVGTADLLLSDSERLATAATQAGVDVTLQIGEGLPHVYQLLLGTPEAAQATEQTGRFLRARVR